MAPAPAMDLYLFRPGEEARMLARCQFRIDKLGRCSATFTYPSKSMSWRRSTIKRYEIELDDGTRTVLYAEVGRLRREAPKECLDDSMLWSDTTEIANAITRDRKSGKLCVEIALIGKGGELADRYFMCEDAPAFVSSALYKTVTALIRPYEAL
jgi:hypothetical protein